MLAHGGGGKLMHQLIGKMFLEAFRNPLLETQHDAAVMELTGKKIAFTTDSYVVRPLFFPGGDIGSMAVHGTVNDLAMAGARPLYLSSAFIIEEGLPMETLWKVVGSMRDAAKKCGVQIVTGDTKAGRVRLLGSQTNAEKKPQQRHQAIYCRLRESTMEIPA